MIASSEGCISEGPSSGYAGSFRSGECWYAVNCATNREFVASSHLRKQGFAVFLPSCMRTRRHARRFDVVRRPLFPGYLFVRLDLSRDRWRSVNGTVGVVRLIGSSQAPTAVPVGVVEAIASACDEFEVLQIGGKLRPGDSIRVAVGPFTDLVGLLESLDGAGRVRVLLEIMGRRTSVVLPRHFVVSESIAA